MFINPLCVYTVSVTMAVLCMCVCLSVSLSVITIAETSLISTLKQRYIQVWYRLFSLVDFQKNFRSSNGVICLPRDIAHFYTKTKVCKALV